MPFFEVDLVDNKTERYTIEAENAKDAYDKACEMTDTELEEMSWESEIVHCEHYVKEEVKECEKP